MPEAQLTLGQAAIYMATAPKSNASAMAIWDAMSDVKEGRTLPVPKHLRDTHYKQSAKLGHGKGYKYAHDFEGGYVEQDYLGVDKTYYTPTNRGYEETIRKRLEEWRKRGARTDKPESGDRADGSARPAPPDRKSQ
jgi:putative ATPase